MIVITDILMVSPEHDFRWVFITRFLMQQGVSTVTGCVFLYSYFNTHQGILMLHTCTWFWYHVTFCLYIIHGLFNIIIFLSPSLANISGSEIFMWFTFFGRFLEYWLSDMIQLPDCWNAGRGVAIMLLPMLFAAALRYEVCLQLFLDSLLHYACRCIHRFIWCKQMCCNLFTRIIKLRIPSTNLIANHCFFLFLQQNTILGIHGRIYHYSNFVFSTSLFLLETM
jgi:hypothetical protein